MRVAPFALVAALALTGCRNPCQDLCVQMKLYAEDTCGFTVPDAELDACISDQAIVTAEEKDICRETGDQGSIENSWDCDALAVYFGGPTGT